MSQSLVKNHLHIVFGTKNKECNIVPEIETELYKYIAGIGRKLACPAQIINGHKNHVHVLCLLSQNIALSKLIQRLKGSSSRWIKQRFQNFDHFYWQNGYGAFSVSPHEIDKVVKYIKNQKQHHLKTSYENEYLHFLKKNKIEFDENYIWD